MSDFHCGVKILYMSLVEQDKNNFAIETFIRAVRYSMNEAAKTLVASDVMLSAHCLLALHECSGLLLIMKHFIQRSAKRLVRGCEKFPPGLAWLVLSKTGPLFSPTL